MLLEGLWYGVNLCSIIWGILHGLVLAIHKIFAEYLPTATDGKRNIIGRITGPLFSLITFHFVVPCWIFFRPRDLDIALTITHNIGDPSFSWQQWHTITMGYRNVFLLVTTGYVWYFFLQNMNEQLKNSFGNIPILFKAAIITLTFWIIYAIASGGTQLFIYLQF